LRKTLLNIAIFFSIIIFCSFTYFKYSSISQSNQIIVSFITYNGYSNNLYIDNIALGERPSYDIALTSINNIKEDTSYTPGSSTYSIIPEVNLTNVGLSSVTNIFGVTMTISSMGYQSTDSVESINAGQSITIYFDTLLIIPGSDLDIIVFSSWQKERFKS